jgi:hypothetical protein
MRQPDILDRLGATLVRLAPYLVLAVLFLAVVGICTAQDMFRVVRGGWRREAVGIVVPTPDVWWDFTYNAGYYLDETTNHNDLLPHSSVKWTTEVGGNPGAGSKSVAFDNTASGWLTSRDNVSAGLLGTNARTVLVWSKYGRVTVPESDTLTYFGMANNYAQWDMNIWSSGSPDGYMFYARPNPAGLLQSGLPATNLWHHYGVTFDGTGIVMYLSGTNVATKAIACNTSTSKFYVGGGVGALGVYTGLISETIAYNYNFTSQEMYNASAGTLPATDPVYWYKFAFEPTNYIAPLAGTNNGLLGLSESTAPYYTYTGGVANSYLFDGVDDCITTRTDIVASKFAFSINIFSPTLQQGVTLPNLFAAHDIGDASGSNRIIAISFGGVGGSTVSNSIHIYTFDEAGNFGRSYCDTNAVWSALNKWTHLYIDYDYSRSPVLNIFLDNVQITPIVTDVKDIGVREWKKIALSQENTTTTGFNYLNAYLDDFRFWTNTLSSAERTAVYNERRQ